jgi:purine nucleoside phosphorylase
VSIRWVMRALIAGTSLLGSSVFDTWKDATLSTPYGEVYLRKTSGYLFLQRHGIRKVPPHNINHLANVWALKSSGVTKVVAINSVGSLQPGLKPGTFAIPDDFFSPCRVPTFFEEEMKFTVPRMDEPLAKELYQISRSLGMKVSLGGIYIQTIGPRLETRAEIKFFRQYGDMVGMTLASEATLCMEQQIPYASICSIDNYCHGIMKKPLTVTEIVHNARKSMQALEQLVRTLVEEKRP